jgi:hypothetical protein
VVIFIFLLRCLVLYAAVLLHDGHICGEALFDVGPRQAVAYRRERLRRHRAPELRAESGALAPELCARQPAPNGFQLTHEETINGGNMPRGANKKREHEYEELKRRFEEEGRYKGREEEVASRIVNKQRAQYGETKGQNAEERKGKNPDRNLPIEHYRHLKIPQVESKAEKLSPKQIDKVEQYEKKHQKRAGAIEALEKEEGEKGQEGGLILRIGLRDLTAHVNYALASPGWLG